MSGHSFRVGGTTLRISGREFQPTNREVIVTREVRPVLLDGSSWVPNVESYTTSLMFSIVLGPTDVLIPGLTSVELILPPNPQDGVRDVRLYYGELEFIDHGESWYMSPTLNFVARCKLKVLDESITIRASFQETVAVQDQYMEIFM